MATKLWRALTKPWLGAMLEDVRLCRVVVIVCAVLGVGHMLGYSLWPCVFAKTTGLPCPGCGMTRAIAALLHGKWKEALRFHPMSPAFLVLGIMLVVSAVLDKTRRVRLAERVTAFERRTGCPTIILVLTMIYGLLRMGGICSNSALVKEPPLMRAWFQERMERGSPASTQQHSTHTL